MAENETEELEETETTEEVEEEAEPEEEATTTGTVVEYEELDMSEIEAKEGFSKHTHAGKSAWDRSKIQEVIRKLHESTDENQVRVLPISWIWENLRINQNMIKYIGYFCKQNLVNEAEALGMPIVAVQVGCVNSTLNGQIEVRFK